VGLRKAGAWLGLVEGDGDELSYAEGSSGDAYAEDDQTLEEEAPAGLAAGPGFRIASVHAQNFRDAHTIGEYFRQDIPVIINLTDMSGPDAKRIVDFASGLIFGRRGDIDRLSSRVFLLLPPRYEVLKEHGPLTDEGFFNQA
jgi:cell division inhibitor SepF